MIEVSGEGIMFTDNDERQAWIDMPGDVADIVRATITGQRMLLRDAAILLAAEFNYHESIVGEAFECVMQALRSPYDGERNTQLAAAERVQV